MGHDEAFTIEIVHRCVRVAGELDVKTALIMTDTVDDIRDPVSIDLSDVTFIDSSGLSALLALLRARPQVRIAAVSARVLRVLQITDTVFILEPNTVVGSP
jgi:anti-anti-sigma factor